ncbi:MAG: preprotein translocase subunit SecG [Candidatus Omnitrophota bacterium]
MYIFILIVHIIVSLIMVAVILLQAGKGGGLADTFGGGGSQTTIFGQKASAFLTKATTVSAVLFLCTSLSLAVLSSRRQKSLMEGANIIMPPGAGLPAAVTDMADDVKRAAKTTVKHVEIDPITGEETVTREETLPVTEGDIKAVEDMVSSETVMPAQTEE